MAPWPLGWKKSARLASIRCECCGREDRRPVPGSLGVGVDTGLLCASPHCRFCMGWCRATFLVADCAGEGAWTPLRGEAAGRSGMADLAGEGTQAADAPFSNSGTGGFAG